MKQKITFKGQKPFGRKLATMLGALTFCLIAACVIAVYGITAKVEVAFNRETKTSVTTTNMISNLSIKNQNAGVSGKRFVEKTKTTKETTTTEKVTSKKAVKKTTAETTKKTTKATKETTKKVTKKTTAKTTYSTKKVTKSTTKVTKQKTTKAKKLVAENNSNKTISYTNEEFEMLCYVLQNEVGYMSDSSKIAVANIIINRVKSSQFPNTLSEVLTSPNQFTAIKNYYNKSNAPTNSIRNCALRALNGENNIGNAVYYYAPKYCGGSTAQWFESLTFCAELEGQRFFC